MHRRKIDRLTGLGGSVVSIKDIAAQSGFSIATVSKALNDHKDVSVPTKQLIRETAARLGYFPNAQARALKTNRTYNIGVVFNERTTSGLEQNYFASILNSFKKQVEKLGYDITFISPNIGSRQMTLYEHCLYRSVDGVFVVCVDDYIYDALEELLQSDLPMICLDYEFKGHGSVLSDNYTGMCDLTEYIINNGHKEIAYIYGDASEVTQTRVIAFRDTLARLNITIREEFLLRGQYHDAATAGTLVKQVMNCSIRPTCIILPDDFAAIGAMNTLEEMGYSIPDDVSIAGYDGIMLSQVIRPRLATIRQNTAKLGETAAKKLVSLINKDPSADISTVVIQGELIEGASVAKMH